MAAPLSLKIAALEKTSPRRATAAILVTSATIFAALMAVIYGHGRSTTAPAWVAWLPFADAAFNATSAVFLVLAFRAIRRRNAAMHARHVLTALSSSALFLVSYVVYHSVHGDTRFAGHGLVRPIYFSILISHVALSGCALPLVFVALFFSLSGRFARHRAIARWTLPVWLYVSVTGVLVFLLLRAYA